MRLIIILLILIPFLKCHNVHKHYKTDKSTESHFENHNEHSNFDRDALFGSSSNELDQLPPEEAKKKLKDFIINGKLDENQDGFVTKNELSKWVLNSFQSISKQDALDQLKEEDENNDGSISWEEHFKNNFNLGAEQNIDEKEMIYEDQELFKAADENNDKLLNKEEYAAFVNPEDYSSMYDTLFKLTMKKRDRNGDGLLSFQEYILNDRNQMPDKNSESYIIDKDKFENDYDKNKDGYLDKEEILSWIIPNSVELANEEAEHLINACDDNKDQVLTIDEIVNNYDVFLESEITQYGDKLKEQHDEL